ncbi:MAG: threonine synthase [SAR86 cluster bacterium]|nr:threonine synthase [SAR86 cluster bacterium]
MLYKSTRGQSPEVSFSEVLLGGLAPDGGLYMPTSIPKFSIQEINDFKDLQFHELATEILFPFVEGDINKEIFSDLVQETYKVFEVNDVVELVELEKNRQVLELFHGPTLAFKDVAMQLLGSLLDHFAKEQGKKIAVLGATSGDTGAAAISACSRHANVEVFILYPHNKVTDIQRRQMTTSGSSNVYPLAIESDFDGCQSVVKRIFLDKDFHIDSTRFIAANSINWARCMTQSVYFFWAYLKLREKNKDLIFSIPSGNFGHAYAGWIAKQMGLPIKKLLIATNSNDVLHKLFSENNYEKSSVDQTLAPSMDISVASNFERLLYNLHDNNPDVLSSIMAQFPEKPISIPEERWDSVVKFFSSDRCSDQEIKEQIKKTYEESSYLLDPHTATGVRASNNLESKDELVVTMATAHPAKFGEAIEGAIPGYDLNIPKRLNIVFDKEESYEVLSEDYEEVKQFILSNVN